MALHARGTANASDASVHTDRIRSALAVLMIASGMMANACYVETYSGPGYVDGYEPAFYDGYVVYYDDLGRPYYYAGGVVYWVSPESPRYGGLVRHYRVYGPAYHRWVRDYGYRYRDYHGPPSRSYEQPFRSYQHPPREYRQLPPRNQPRRSGEHPEHRPESHPQR